MLEKYKDWLFVNVGSPNTVKTYLYHIGKLLERYKSIDKLNEENITQFLKEIKEKYTLATVNSYRYAIQSFLKFHNKEIRLPRHEKFDPKKPDSITKEYFEKEVIPVAECIFQNPLKVKAMLHLMFYTGLRRAEVAGLKRSDIDFNTNRISILGKRKKRRKVPMTKRTAELLNTYLNTEPYSESVFNMNNGGINHIFRVMKPYIKEANFRPLLLRHSYATHLLKQGMTLPSVSELLGHSNIQTTMRYVDTNLDAIQAEFNKKVR